MNGMASWLTSFWTGVPDAVHLRVWRHRANAIPCPYEYDDACLRVHYMRAALYIAVLYTEI